MTSITNTILSPSIPNPQYKKSVNGRLTLTLITPNCPNRCVSWNYNRTFPKLFAAYCVFFFFSTHSISALRRHLIVHNL